jgi:predicted nucleic acid-binding protein
VVRALLDTNILIDHLNGYPQARAELQRHTRPAISIMTWMEVMIGAKPAAESCVTAFLATFEVIPLDDDIAARAVALRKIHRMRLPDAVIWASAQARDMLLVTRNTKDFPPDDPSIRAPYQL